MPVEFMAAAKQKREKDKAKAACPPQPKKNPTPGLLNITTMFESVKKPGSRQAQPAPTQPPPPQPPNPEPQLVELTDAMDGAAIDARQEISKKLKKLRKKIREIEDIEAKVATGETKKLEKDQQDKVRKKQEILNEIKQLDAERKELIKWPPTHFVNFYV